MLVRILGLPTALILIVFLCPLLSSAKIKESIYIRYALEHGTLEEVFWKIENAESLSSQALGFDSLENGFHLIAANPNLRENTSRPKTKWQILKEHFRKSPQADLSILPRLQDLIALLTQKGASLSQPNTLGTLPVDIALWSGQYDLARLFLQAGSPISLRTLHSALTSGYLDGDRLIWVPSFLVHSILQDPTAQALIKEHAAELLWATFSVNRSDFVLKLIDRYKINVNTPHPRTGESLALAAAQHLRVSSSESMHFLASLLDRGAHLKGSTSHKDNVFHLIAIAYDLPESAKDHYEKIRILQQVLVNAHYAGANINLRNRDNFTPLDLALLKDATYLLHAFRSLGAKVDHSLVVSIVRTSRLFELRRRALAQKLRRTRDLSETQLIHATSIRELIALLQDMTSQSDRQLLTATASHSATRIERIAAAYVLYSRDNYLPISPIGYLGFFVESYKLISVGLDQMLMRESLNLLLRPFANDLTEDPKTYQELMTTLLPPSSDLPPSLSQDLKPFLLNTEIQALKLNANTVFSADPSISESLQNITSRLFGIQAAKLTLSPTEKKRSQNSFQPPRFVKKLCGDLFK